MKRHKWNYKDKTDRSCLRCETQHVLMTEVWELPNGYQYTRKEWWEAAGTAKSSVCQITLSWDGLAKLLGIL